MLVSQRFDNSAACRLNVYVLSFNSPLAAAPPVTISKVLLPRDPPKLRDGTAVGALLRRSAIALRRLDFMPSPVSEDCLISPEQIGYLKTVDSPTIANAIETFNVRDRTEGFIGGGIQSVFPGIEPMV